MIAERIDLGLDVDALRAHVERHVLPLRPAMQTIGYGGWSVLSASGEYFDGWEQGHLIWRGAGPTAEQLRATAAKEHAQRIPTPLCRGAIADALERVCALGLKPFRVRLALLRAGHSTSRHRDGTDGFYRVRLHIPVITNPGCRFETDDEGDHMPADGAGYLVSVARWHQAVNRGETARVHLMMGVTDTKGISRHHRPPEDHV